MNGSWSKVPLHELLRRSEEAIDLQADVTYRQVTVKLKGAGVVERCKLLGSEIASIRQYVVRQNQFIISRIDARNGASGLVPNELDGAVVSNDFPVFNINQSRLLPNYLKWLSRTQVFVNLCRVASEGTTNRVRLQENRFLSLELPLPDLHEQARIVARIEELAARAQSARKLIRDQGKEVEHLQQSYIDAAIPSQLRNAPPKPFGTYLRRNRSVIPLDSTTRYQGIGIKWWGLGSYVHESKLGTEFNAERYIIAPGQIAYNEVWAHIGSIAVIGDHGSNLVASRHFHIFDVDWSELLPDFVTWIFRSTWFWNECREGSFSSTGRGHMRREHLFAIKLPVPSLPVQRELVAYLNTIETKVTESARLHADAAADADALLPSILDKAFRGEL